MAAQATWPAELERELDRLVFSKWDPQFLETEQGRHGRRQVLVGRYEAALRHALPWLRRHVDLPASRVVEVGCGSGSSTAALAAECKNVIGVDIDGDSVAAAEARCRAYGRDNVELHTVEPEALQPFLRTVAAPEVFILYAVLEHQTWQERIETLRTLWERLPAGGWLAIIETPNRLVYSDRHSSGIDFHHLLPDELAFEYVARSPNLAYRDTMKAAVAAHGVAGAALPRIRWGLGASFHELEIALGEDLRELVWADGTEDEMKAMFGEELDDELLARFFVARVRHVPIGFARAVLNVLLRKPRGPEDRAEARRLNEARVAAAERALAPAAPRPTPAVTASEERVPTTELGRELARRAVGRGMNLLRSVAARVRRR